MNSFYSKEELNKIGFKSIGENVLISKNAKFYGASNMTIGNNVRIDDFCILSGKITLGNYIHISAYCALYAGEYGIEFKNYSGCSSRTIIYAVCDDFSGEYMTNSMVPDEYKNITGSKVVLEENTQIGAGSIVLPGCILKRGSAVGAMSLVNKSLEENSLYVGSPCKKIKKRSLKMYEYTRKLEKANEK